jgi:hypothetical protein
MDSSAHFYIDTVATFFPAKEETNYINSNREDNSPRVSRQSDGTDDGKLSQENIHASHKPPSKAAFGPCDLRDEIYDEMNGGENTHFRTSWMFSHLTQCQIHYSKKERRFSAKIASILWLELCGMQLRCSWIRSPVPNLHQRI